MSFVLSVLCASFLILFLGLYAKQRKAEKFVHEPSMSSARPGFLQALHVYAIFSCRPRTPNYKLVQDISAKFGRRIIAAVPFHREVLAIVDDLNVAKQIMKAPGWTNRFPDGHYIFDLSFKKPLGLLFGNGKDWKEARRITMKLLHNLQFFKQNYTESLVSYEAAEFERRLIENMGKNGQGFVTICPPKDTDFGFHSLNVLLHLIMSKRFEYGDPVVEDLLHLFDRSGRLTNIGTTAVDFFPWLRHIPGLTFMDALKKSSDACYNLFRIELLERRRASLKYMTAPQDFSDYFLQEIDRQRKEGLADITDETFLVCMRDLVFAGADTSSVALKYGILHVSLQADIQRKVQAEIDRVIGPTRVPCYDDRKRMIYTQAVLWETLRIATPVPITSRSPLADTQLEKDMVPKGSIFAINLYSIHRSKELWPDPYAFRPERFLNEELDEIINLEKVMPFGYGRRVCIGESLAQVTIFIFLVRLLQRFTFKLSEKHPPPSMNSRGGVTRTPMPYYVKVCPRE